MTDTALSIEVRPITVVDGDATTTDFHEAQFFSTYLRVPSGMEGDEDGTGLAEWQSDYDTLAEALENAYQLAVEYAPRGASPLPIWWEGVGGSRAIPVFGPITTTAELVHHMRRDHDETAESLLDWLTIRSTPHSGEAYYPDKSVFDHIGDAHLFQHDNTDNFLLHIHRGIVDQVIQDDAEPVLMLQPAEVRAGMGIPESYPTRPAAVEDLILSAIEVAGEKSNAADFRTSSRWAHVVGVLEQAQEQIPTEQPEATRCYNCGAVVLIDAAECGRCLLAFTTEKPKWRVVKDRTPFDPAHPWQVLRDPIPEEDTRIPNPANDDRTCIDNGEHATMESALAAALEGAALDAPIYATFTD